MKFRMQNVKIVIVAIFITLSTCCAAAQKPKRSDVRLEIQRDPTGKTLVKWSITNRSKLAIYVYDVFLWGPGAWNETEGNHLVLGTAPAREVGGCPPNRVAPVLLLVIAPGRTIHGDFIDDRLKIKPGSQVSMRIVVFADPYTVVKKTKQFFQSNCTHDPYDALVREGTIIDSNTIRIH